MLEHVKKMGLINLKLHLNIIEADISSSKDPNGSANPFAIIYFSTDSKNGHQTCVAYDTLNPTWNQQFDLY